LLSGGFSEVVMGKKRFLILDANVLIDFLKCDRTIIKLICSYVGQVYLATPVFDEIKDLSENDCIELGLKLLEPELEHLLLASEPNGPLSFQDNICLLIAKEHGLTCVTNDKPLRQRCEIEGVSLIWGIELICILVESGGITPENAKDIILRIHEDNPKYITKTIIKNAFKRLFPRS
jgi:hypothetical protein